MITYKPVDTFTSTFKAIILPNPLFSDPTWFCQIMRLLFNISHLQDQASTLLLTKSLSLCILLQILIGLLLNIICIIFRVQ